MHILSGLWLIQPVVIITYSFITHEGHDGGFARAPPESFTLDNRLLPLDFLAPLLPGGGRKLQGLPVAPVQYENTHSVKISSWAQ